MRRTIIAVDFDGTICHNNFPNIGKFYENCSDVINRLQSKGIIVILNTCRCDKLLEQALTACSNNGIIFDAVNENYSKLPFKTSNKIYADYYIDDKALIYNNKIDWLYFEDFILKNIKTDKFIII